MTVRGILRKMGIILAGIPAACMGLVGLAAVGTGVVLKGIADLTAYCSGILCCLSCFPNFLITIPLTLLGRGFCELGALFATPFMVTLQVAAQLDADEMYIHLGRIHHDMRERLVFPIESMEVRRAHIMGPLHQCEYFWSEAHQKRELELQMREQFGPPEALFIASCSHSYPALLKDEDMESQIGHLEDEIDIKIALAQSMHRTKPDLLMTHLYDSRIVTDMLFPLADLSSERVPALMTELKSTEREYKKMQGYRVISC